MRGQDNVSLEPATDKDKSELFALMREHLADMYDRLVEPMGLTWEQFAELYRTTGDVRVIRRNEVDAGHIWIELRGRELHLHAFFVFPDQRGQGVGRSALRVLEREFESRADFVELGVRQDNAGARRLYRSEGFAETDELADLGFVVMRKYLGQQSRFTPSQ